MRIAFSLIISAAYLFLRWKLLSKMGQPGWYSLIPGLGTYTMYAGTKRKAAAIMLICLTILNYILAGIVIVQMFSVMLDYASLGDDYVLYTDVLLSNLIRVGIVMIPMGIVSVVIVVIKIVLNTALARCFGKSSSFGIGLTFLPLIFQSILAFGYAEYYPLY